MKRLIVFLMALMPATMVLASDDKPISFEQLPAVTKEFIKKNFPDAKVALATVESAAWNPTYDVIFTDGTKMEFLASGEWKEIDCKYSRVPDSVIPANILAFIKEHHPDSYVKEIERGRRKYDVKLDNRLELRFDSSGVFRGYDN